MLRIAGVLLLIVMASACSSTSFFYNRLDFLLPWYVEDYADLNDEQREFLDQRLKPFLEWHRTTELPCYVVLLTDLDAALNEELTAADIARISRDFEVAWYRTQDEALDWLLELGEKLSDEQVQEFLQELDKRQKDLEEEFIDRSDEEFREDSFDQMIETGADYLGRLQKPQRKMMREASERLIRSDRLWLAERAAFIEDLRTLMAREPGWQPRVRELIDKQVESPSPEYAKVLEQNVAAIQSLTADMLNSRTARQDKHLRSELNGLRLEFDSLVAETEAAGECPVTPAEVAESI